MHCGGDLESGGKRENLMKDADSLTKFHDNIIVHMQVPPVLLLSQRFLNLMEDSSWLEADKQA